MAGANRVGGNIACDGTTDMLSYDRLPPEIRKALREAPHPLSAFMAQQQYRTSAIRYGAAEATDSLLDAIDGMVARYLEQAPAWWAAQLAEGRAA